MKKNKEKYLKKAEILGKNAGDKDIQEVDKKLTSMKKGPVKKIWEKVLFLWESYKKAEIPVRLQITIIGALLYLIIPADTIPDVIPGIGLIDDCSVILIVFTELSKFLMPKVVKKVQKNIEESYYLKIDFKLKEVFYTMLLNSVITFVLNLTGVFILLSGPGGKYSQYIAYGIFCLVFVYTIVRFIIYLKNYGSIIRQILNHIWQSKSLSRGIGNFVEEQYPLITKIYAGINIAQNFIPGLDSVPDFDLIVKDFISHYRKRLLLISSLFLLYGIIIFLVKIKLL